MGSVYKLRRFDPTMEEWNDVIEYGEIFVRHWCERNGHVFNQTWNAIDVFNLMLPSTDLFLYRLWKRDWDNFVTVTEDN